MATRRRLPPLPTVNDLLRMYNIRAKKNLSQNFLLDPRLLDRIARKAGNLAGMHVVEVGPGPGGITRSILGQGAQSVVVVEKDARFIPSLQFLNQVGGNRMEIHQGDILNFPMDNLFHDDLRRDWSDRGQPGTGDRGVPDIRVIGNLPFNISTPLIIRWMRNIADRNSIFSYGRVPLFLTFQHEVARRIVSPPGDRQRSRLSVVCQNWTNANYEFMISGGSFVPAPEVDVGLVSFRPLIKPYIDLPFSLVNHVVTATFQGKRKHISNSLATLFPNELRKELVDQLLILAKLDREMMAINLKMADFSRLCHAYVYLCELNPNIANYQRRIASSSTVVDECSVGEVDEEEKIEKME